MPIERRGQYRPRTEGEQVERVRLPRGREVFGIVESMLGANKLRVRCADNKMRICRIPGRLRKRVWMRENDLIIVEPWAVQTDTNGDAIWKYTAAQVEWIRRKGFLKMEM